MAWLPMMTSLEVSAMLPAARMMCPSSILLTVGSVDFPAFLGRQNSAEWIGLRQRIELRYALTMERASNLVIDQNSF
jgi:hypothetical protein